MKKIITYSCVCLITLLSGCVTIESREYSKYVEVDKKETFSAQLPEDALVELRLPPGRIDIVSSQPGEGFSASVSRRCPEPELQDCELELNELEFITKRRTDRFILTTSKNRVFNDNENLTFTIAVPDIAFLDLDVTAGEVNVSKLDACFQTELTAGAVHIEADYDMTRSVKIEASAGDTSLKVNGRRIDEDRFLMRSKTHWSKGEGKCELEAEVSAGEITVELI